MILSIKIIFIIRNVPLYTIFKLLGLTCQNINERIEPNLMEIIYEILEMYDQLVHQQTTV